LLECGNDVPAGVLEAGTAYLQPLTIETLTRNKPKKTKA